MQLITTLFIGHSLVSDKLSFIQEG